jgi:hypothetical protein
MSLAKRRRLKALRAEEARQMDDLAKVPTEEECRAALRDHYGWPDADAIKGAPILRDFYIKWSTPRPRHGLHAAIPAEVSR